MNELITALYGNLKMSDDMKAFVITVLFIFIISISVDIISMLKQIGGSK